MHTIHRLIPLRGRGITPRKHRTTLVAAAVALVVATAVAGTGVGAAAPAGGPGSLLAFGYNQFGQLGTTDNNGKMGPNPAPASVALPGAVGPVTQVAAGFEYSLAVTASGQLYAFGNNFYGELGSSTNTGTATPNPTPAPVALPGAVGPVAQISAGSTHSLVLTASGQVYAFGSNLFGQIGSATNFKTANPNPTPAVVGLPGQIGRVTQIAAGGSHSLVVTASGQLFAFGYDGYGELGVASDPGSSNPTPALVTLPGEVGPVTQVAAGDAHSLAVTASGQLYAFGDNDDGELGNATNLRSGEPNPTPTPVTLPGEVGPVTQVSAGAHHSLALTASGQLYAFGSNELGELGVPTNPDPNHTPVLVTLPGLVGHITKIVAGLDDSLVVTSSGQLYGFGYNIFGELGRDTNVGIATANPTPTLVPLPAGTTIDTVATGGDAYHTLAIVSDLAIESHDLPTGQVGTVYQAALAASGGTDPLRWAADGLPAGLAIDPASGVVSGIPSGSGDATTTVTVTDAYGSSATVTLAVHVAPSPAAATAVPPTPTTPAAPRLVALGQSSSRWLAGSKLASLTGRNSAHGVGTTFSFGVDRPSRVTFAFHHNSGGRRLGTSCVARTPRTASKPHCTRVLSDGTLRVEAPAGTSHLHFEGPISRLARLAPGSYSVVISATDLAGTSSASQVLHFTIARR